MSGSYIMNCQTLHYANRMRMSSLQLIPIYMRLSAYSTNPLHEMCANERRGAGSCTTILGLILGILPDRLSPERL
jgi:hypothetical protein